MQNDVMQCGKCVRDLLRNLVLLSLGRMSQKLTVIMKAADPTEMSVHMYWTTRRHIPANSKSTRHVGHASRNVCDNRNVRSVLAREPTRSPRAIT